MWLYPPDPEQTPRMTTGECVALIATSLILGGVLMLVEWVTA